LVYDGAWRSLVARVLWEHEVPGSNPGAPILVVRYLHILAMALFVGGQLVLVVAVVPGLRGRDREGLRAVARRFGWASVGALVVLVVTGASTASSLDRWDDGQLQLKLGLVVLVGVLIVWHLRNGAAHWLQGAIFVVSLVIVWLGLALAH
jgi:putative copper export protein